MKVRIKDTGEIKHLKFENDEFFSLEDMIKKFNGILKIFLEENEEGVKYVCTKEGYDHWKFLEEVIDELKKDIENLYLYGTERDYERVHRHIKNYSSSDNFLDFLETCSRVLYTNEIICH
jgi:hypothetical protein